MALKVIGAGLGRTGTLSLKLALEHLGFGPCYHMSEMLSQLRSHLPLWIESAKGRPQWDTIFRDYQSSTDYPGCMFWRDLAAYYPGAKIVLSTRDPERWFESGAATVFSDPHRARFESNPMMAEFFRLTVFDDLESRLDLDRSPVRCLDRTRGTDGPGGRPRHVHAGCLCAAAQAAGPAAGRCRGRDRRRF